ncbi:hypothetical protein [Buchananella hordeovulneris]|uniref:hypothetical protein n=1 Tax=Buchananella hordeovulneris TaxID=52770 RepID=UPI000F5DA868|nr:hypothetical protein [Buchananella hordeovulneris]RRD45467.1 hypothetical protein EII13_00970 [Buchananella hordeovulneris]
MTAGSELPAPRIVLAESNGIDTRDSQTGELLSFMRRAGTSALSNSGDSQYVIYTEADQFGVFATGLQAFGNDDGIHYHGDTPSLTSIFYPAPQAGHVVTNLGVTTFFANGTGQASAIEVGSLGNPTGALPPLQAQSPHAGFAVWVGGDFLLTQGDRSGATGVQVIRDGQPVGEVVDCPQAQPGTAGAETDHGSVYVVGCRGAFLLYQAGELYRFTLPQSAAAAQLTDLVGSDSSPWVLARVESGAAQTTTLALIDIRDASLKLLELPAAASAQTLARGPNGEGLVLTSDGQLLILDPERATIVDQIPVFSTATGAQPPDAPIVQARRDLAFLLSPLRDEVVVLDIPTRTIKNRLALVGEIIDMEVADPVDITSMPVFE